MRAIRGATTVLHNTSQAIEIAAAELVEVMITKNSLNSGKIVAIIFSCTKDLTAAYPAKGVREHLGLHTIPMFCTQEQYVEGALELCIRVLILCDDENKNTFHIYLNDATNLRSDLKFD